MQERGTSLLKRVYHVLRNLKVASKNQVVLLGLPRLPQPCPTAHPPHTRQCHLALGPFFSHFVSWPRAWTGKGDMVQVMVIHRSEVRIRWLGSTPSWALFSFKLFTAFYDPFRKRHFAEVLWTEHTQHPEGQLSLRIPPHIRSSHNTSPHPGTAAVRTLRRMERWF